MSLSVGFEAFEGGSWKKWELKNSNASHLVAIAVGTRDFVLDGTQKEIVRWLADFNKPVKCAEGYGSEVWIILRGKAATASEEIAKAYGDNFGGVGGIGSCIFTGISAFASIGNVAGTLGAAAFNASDINIDSIIDKIRGGKVSVRISCAKGPYRNSGSAKDSIFVLPSGLSARYSAGALAALKW